MKNLLFQGFALFLLLPMAMAKVNVAKEKPVQKAKSKTSSFKESSFSAKGLKRLDFKNDSGKSRIYGTSSEEIKVSIDKIEWHDDCRFESEGKGKTFVVKVRHKAASCLFCSKKNCKANIEVSVPSRFALEANSGSGDMIVKEINGELSLDVGSGDLEVSSSKAPKFEAKAGSGDVRVKNLESKEISLRTGSGRIKLEGLKTKELDVRSGSGDFFAKGRFEEVLIAIGSGDIEIVYETLPSKGKTSLKSGSGSADLSFPKGSKIDVEFHAGSGKLSSELPISDKKAQHKVKMRAGSGSLRIKSL